jgi:hypothetical protein
MKILSPKKSAFTPPIVAPGYRSTMLNGSTRDGIIERRIMDIPIRKIEDKQGEIFFDKQDELIII